jgi:hypothetical protein
MLGVVAPTGALAGGVVYRSDFAQGTGGFTASSPGLLTTFSRPTDDGGPASANQAMYLGKLAGNDSVSLGLSGLTAGQTYTVSFDLFIGGSWDGNSTGVGPDRWLLTAGGTKLVDTSFLNITADDNAAGNNNLTQDYSDADPLGGGAPSAAYSGADVLYGQNIKNGYFDRYAIYGFSHGVGNPMLTFTAGGSTETLTFAGFGLQGADDEYWSLGNVTVFAVPEPGALGLGLAFGGCLALARRVRRGRAVSANS